MPDLKTVYLPESVTPKGIAWIITGAFFSAFAFLYLFNPFTNIVAASFFMLALMAAVTLAWDVAIYRVHLRPSTGMDYSRADSSISRVVVKLVGLYATLAILAVFYWILPEYENDTYQYFMSLARTIVLPLAVFSIPYFFFVDAYQESPRDGYWNFGRIFFGNWSRVDLNAVREHILSWIVKGFFLPLMFGLFCLSLQEALDFRVGSDDDFSHFYALLFSFVFLFDLSISTVGYATTLRPFDTHIRSSEPTTLGWFVAIVCYAPFWGFVYNNYLYYESDWQWGNWLWNSPVLYGVWGTLILLCLCVYVYATAQFGCRFSNLTYRGTITSGPYRWTKHPAYVFKNLSWWLMAIPFIPGDGSPLTAIQNCLLLGGVSGIYFLRAKTEERHLSRYPEYVSYAMWIESNGIFRWVPSFRTAF